MTDSASRERPEGLGPPPSAVTAHRSARSWLESSWIETRAFLRAVFVKAAADNIFFMAGAIAFNVLVAFIPLVLAVLGIAGTILQLQHTDATEPLLRYLLEAIPPVSDEFQLWVRGLLDQLIEESAGILSLSTIFLIWLATRLIGTLRTALREVFDIQVDRGIIRGKLFDAKMVVAAGTLLALNVGVTIVLEIVAERGFDALGLQGRELHGVQVAYARLLAFLVIWLMFLLIYRYLPARRIGWRTALTAATFTAFLFELLKWAFAWYVANVAVFHTTYGNLATILILIFWIYYLAVAFILGGEVAQVAAMRRIRHQQKLRLR